MLLHRLPGEADEHDAAQPRIHALPAPARPHVRPVWQDMARHAAMIAAIALACAIAALATQRAPIDAAARAALLRKGCALCLSLLPAWLLADLLLARLRAGRRRILLLAATPAAAHRAQAMLRQCRFRQPLVVAIGTPGAPGGAAEAAIAAAMEIHGAGTIALALDAASAAPLLALGLRLARRHANVLALCDDPPCRHVIALSGPGLRLRARDPGRAQRCADAAIAALALLILAPFLAAIALAIRLDSPGPALFRQARCGWRGQSFQILKFRTMRADPQPQGALIQTRRGDPRVTRIGKFLRRTSIDELPQLINVLRGDMALVGPRPHALDMTVAGQPMEALLAEYGARHAVRPGITGWAQVNGSRGEVVSLQALRRRLALDLHYVAHRSMRLNLRILLRTLLLIVDRHAY